MVPILTETTSLLSNEFVSIFSKEKLAVTLSRISKDTGVAFTQTQKSFSIIGDWRKVLEAYAVLEENFLAEQNTQSEEEQIKDVESESLTSGQSPNQIETRRGRKPGCSVGKSSFSAVPEPYVQYYDNEGLTLTIHSRKNERTLYKERKINSDRSEKVCADTSSRNPTESNDKKIGNEEVLDYINNIDTNDVVLRNDQDNCVNTEKFDDKDGNIKEEFNDLDDAADESTDVDEQYSPECEVTKTANDCANERNIFEVKVEECEPKANESNVVKSRTVKSKQPVKKRQKASGKSKVGTSEKVRKTNVRNDEEEQIEESETKLKKSTKCKDESDKKLKCEFCDYVGTNRKNFKNHVKRMHRSSKFQCEICNKQFGLNKDLLRHTRTVHSSTSYHCSTCDKCFKYERKYKAHMLKHEGDNIKPVVQEDHTQDSCKEFRCELCEYVGTKRENLREHTKRMHRNKFQCETCNRQFGLHKDLLRHTRNVHASPAFHCKICNKSYKFNRTYQAHMLSHEVDYIKPHFQCEICNKVFSTKYVLSSHVKSEHLGVKKSFLCPTCGRSFTQKNSYLMHANVHAGIKPYVCDICGKAFSYDKSLKEHKYMHDEERRFNCDVCAKTFRQRTSLVMHMKVHKNAKDYICTSCGKGFTQKQALLRHERIHSGDKPFTCTLCQRSFNDYSIIRRHMMLHHKKDKDPKCWRGDIICSLKRKTEFYIEGGPGYNGGDKLPTPETTNQAGAGQNAVVSSTDDNSIDHSSVTKRITATKLSEGTYTSIQDSVTTGTSGQSGNFVSIDLNTHSSLPHTTSSHTAYSNLVESSDSVCKMESAEHASIISPINYSIPTNYQTVIPVTSGQSSDAEEIQRQCQVDAYHLATGAQREMLVQNLSSVTPLPHIIQNSHFTSSAGDATQGQPLPNPWNLRGYPPFPSAANFPNYMGPQN